MVSQGYRDWLNAGRPYTLIRPAKAVQATLRGYGLTVYDYPNRAHLEASTPEDHTPFSATSWPVKNARWRGHALDVMPRSDSAAARKENADVARQLIRDRDAGVPGAMWVKYLNWTDERGICQQVAWKDDAHPLQHTTRSSTDKGHVHISGRSDCADDDRADTYDPIARLAGLDGGDMGYNAQQKADAAFNLQPKVTLDTDGSDNGSGNLKEFDNPLYLAIKGLTERVEQLEQRPAGGGAAPVDVDALAELVAAKLVERLKA